MRSRFELIVALVAIAPLARADSVRVVSGARVEVRRGDGLGPGIERGMPRDGAYGRAIALDAEGRHVEATREFGVAIREWDSLASMTASDGECFAAWRAKATWQREESELLLEQETYAATLPTSPVARLNLATVYHNKYLATRAWLGEGAGLDSLRERAAREYARAIELDRGQLAARVGLATLHAQTGRTREAREAVAALGRRANEPSLSLAIAAWHVALGEHDEALARLESIALRSEQRRWLFRSNDYDALREEDRFRALVDGEPGSGCVR